MAASSFQFVFVLPLFFLSVWLRGAPSEAMSSSSFDYEIAKPGCSSKCGNTTIPYPFGFGDESCNLNQSNFRVTCNESSNPPKLLVNELDLYGIDLIRGEVQFGYYVAYDCYHRNGSQWSYGISDPLAWSGSFTFSDTRNKFVAVGCDTIAYYDGSSYTTGCMSFCNSMNNIVNGSCSGIGCCQTSIPKRAKRYKITIKSNTSHSRIWDFNPCSYAFLVEENWYNFSSQDLRNFQKRTKVPVVLDWAVGKKTCEEARKNLSDYICGANTYCYDPSNVVGYRCNCSIGYEGNPYLANGCRDIDECKNQTLYQCTKNAVCVNEHGGYRCSCKPGYHGDEKLEGCKAIVRGRSTTLKVSLGIGLSFLFLLVAGSWIYWGLKKRKLMQLKEKFFQQNGGLMLKTMLKRENAVDKAKIFTAEELERATDNYDESRIIGRGGFGTVYKGTLTNSTLVAIKKSKIVDNSQIEQFLNEVVVLSQINHRNVVKLIGCCLETEVPLLVYEYVTNGTLFQHLHERDRASAMSLDDRLRIANEIATSLSYLHSEASIPIVHRDVKSSNILLDDNYTAKVADFGASRLVPLDQTQLGTLVQGTLGYLDPEYLHTSQLTEKSDVYSFGVLLAEILTGKRALCFDRPKEEVNLATYFISSMKEDRLFQILEDHLATEGSTEQIQQVAELTKRCLRVQGEKRPTMREIAMVLDGLRRMSVDVHPWVDNIEPYSQEERAYLLAEAPDTSYTGNLAEFDDLFNGGR